MIRIVTGIDELAPVADSIVQAAINSLWHGAVAVGVVWVLLALVVKRGGAMRARVVSLALFLLPLLLVLSVVVDLTFPDHEIVGEGVSARFSGEEGLASGPDFTAIAPGKLAGGDQAAETVQAARGVWPSPSVSVSGGLWTIFGLALLIGGQTLLLVRLGRSLVEHERLKARCHRPSHELQSRFLEHARDFDREVRIAFAVSDEIVQPVLLGLVRPTIVIPTRLIEALDATDLEQIVLHEVAHLKRRDDWWKLGERFVESLVFFNPAVYWLRRRLDGEREVACDEWVVSTTGQRRRYASCLLKLAEFGTDVKPMPIAAGAGGSPSALARRVELLLSPQSRPTQKAARIAAVSALLLVVSAAVWAAFGLGVKVTTPTPVEQTGEPGGLASERSAAESLVLNVPDIVATTPQGTDEALRLETARAIERDDTSFEDPAIRAAAVRALGDRAGTVIAIDPRDGRVLTIVNQEWALRRVFHPASIVKLVTALSALDSGRLTAQEEVVLTRGSRAMTLDRALASSNTDYFQLVGERTGPEPFLRIVDRIGFGQPTGIDYEGELSGRRPEAGDDLRAGHIYGTGERFAATGVQLARFVAAMANGGHVLVPQRALPATAVSPRVRSSLGVSPEVIRDLRTAMRTVVTEGTGRPALDSPFAVAGKTGSSIDTATSTGIFISYAPVDDPRIAVAVVLCGSRVHGRDAAEVAATFYRTVPFHR